MKNHVVVTTPITVPEATAFIQVALGIPQVVPANDYRLSETLNEINAAVAKCAQFIGRSAVKATEALDQPVTATEARESSHA
jgi:hypothetical protein